MILDTSADLISVTYTGAELGRMQRVETKKAVFCTLGSADRREFYAAYNSGFKPEYRVITHPANYAGESIIEILTDSGAVRCDIYRTYRKSADEMELWCVRRNDAATPAVTLWMDARTVFLFGAYITGGDSSQREATGKAAAGTVSLILPQSLLAYSGGVPVGYVRPKAYAAMSAAEKAEHFFIDSSCFFAPGQIAEIGKYQAINGKYDDVHLVQAVLTKNKGTPDTEYLEVIGR